MEKLAALCLLWAFKLGTKEDYCAALDNLFLENPEDDFLLELEDFTRDVRASWAQLSAFMHGEFDVDAFGRELFSRLEKICDSGEVTASEFCERCDALWNLLPAPIDLSEPFYTLSWAGDSYFVSIGKSRELFQKAFDYYKEKP